MKATTLGLRVALASLVLLAAGCGRPTDAADGEGGGYSFPGGDTVALRVDHVGGFVPATVNLTRLPAVSVYADGRVITQGPTTMEYPGRALPNIQLRRISSGDVQALVAKALEAGVGQPTDLGTPGVTDLPNTRIVVTTTDGVKKTEAYALLDDMTNAGLTPAQEQARRKLLDLIKALTDLDTSLGAGKVGPVEQYTPTKVAAVAAAWQDPGAGVDAGPAVAWPGPALPGASLGEGLSLGCVVADKEASAVLAAAAKATAITKWTSGGKDWTVTLRPLLPDETGCESLGK
ncbi:hypothetical protein AB0B31_40790 [Catellatospora citrea]|uniref:hypothetical protein n=1 Tax=Catellatospora citrea TaxID=53366 RepID=UPI0033F20EEA